MGYGLDKFFYSTAFQGLLLFQEESKGWWWCGAVKGWFGGVCRMSGEEREGWQGVGKREKV